ncbi:MFS transporter [Paraurantiacibacter namhicola]|uniref:Putative sulfoacetate transporter SauU n=1 Tax=Paraurantiacibacter namhicola TaxID=645517 RepID=A0A1C7D4J9_9SPHN|nr:MFS transporter [Paraurantiacibacter namhicola]ANU06380.1 putative sulfoacetate transporter SauU [Paraurantiacibacter namhicola]
MTDTKAASPAPSEPERERGEFSAGWKVLLAGLLGVMCGASPIPYNIIGFTAEPLAAEFGWSQTQIVLPITIFGVIASLLAPVFGGLADRFGVRPVALWSLFAFAASFAAIALTPRGEGETVIIIYYALWIVVGLVGIGSTPVTWSRAINLWFFKNRGLALGILLLGTSLAAMIVPQVAVRAIDAYGWRAMFAVVALFPVAALVVGYFLFREPRPEERPAAITSASGSLTGVSLSAALRDYRFYLIWLSIAFIALSFGGAFINMPRILSLKGLDAGTAATIMGILGMGIFAGRIITGFLLDRFWQGFVAFPLLCLPAISCIILIGGDSVSFALAATAGFLLGFAAGAESDLIAYLTGRYFGMAHYGKVYGMLYMPFGLMSAASPIVYAQVFDRTGSFDGALEWALFGFVIGGGLLLFLGKYPGSFPDAGPEPSRAVAGAA